VPTAVAGSDAEALRLVQEAEARGQPLGVNVPAPANVRALTSIAFPTQFGKAQAESLFPKPTSAALDVVKVRGPDGKDIYVRKTDAVGMQAPPNDYQNLMAALAFGRHQFEVGQTTGVPPVAGPAPAPLATPAPAPAATQPTVPATAPIVEPAPTTAPAGVDMSKMPQFSGSPKQIAEQQNKWKMEQMELANAGDKKYSETAATKGAENDAEQYKNANAATDNIQKINLTLKHLRESDAITGLGADILKNVERAKARFGASGKAVSDTELLDSLLGSEVFPMIGGLGIGARGLDTPAEREFLRQVMTGTIQMNKETLIRLTEIRRDVAKRAIEKWNKRVDEGSADRFFQANRIPKGKIQIPEIDVPPTNAKGWKLMRDAKGNRAYVGPNQEIEVVR
jgi:hypothetical protein